jgi:putative flippase GtrA
VIDSSVFLYLLIGVANTFAGLSIIYLGKWLFGLNDVIANMLGYGVGLVLSFTLNKRWTFRHIGPTIPAMGRFLMVVGVAYMANLLVVMYSINFLQFNSYFSQTLGVIPYTVIGYLGSRFYAFSGAASLQKES